MKEPVSVTRMSRRAILRSALIVGGTLVGGSLLAACQAATPAAKPTEAPKPAAEPTKPTEAAKPAAEPTKPAAAAAPATDWPRQPITLIVPWAAGGDTDVPMRVLAEFVSKDLGQPIAVQNVVGAGGSAGIRQAKGARPDGYTLMSIHEHVIVNQHTGVTDFSVLDLEPIALAITTLDMINTTPDKPWKDARDLVDEAKKRPGEITWGMTFGSTAQMFAFGFMHKTDTKYKPVGYEGTAQRVTALLGNQIEVAAGPTSVMQQHWSAGKAKALGFASDKRDPRAPEVPTLPELGIDYTATLGRGWAAPKGTPPEVLKKVEVAMQRALENPELKKKIEEEQGNAITFLAREQYIERLKQQDAELQKVIAETGMTAQG
jgi:putative tricarboxylic transport membrane protein